MAGGSRGTRQPVDTDGSDSAGGPSSAHAAFTQGGGCDREAATSAGGREPGAQLRWYWQDVLSFSRERTLQAHDALGASGPGGPGGAAVAHRLSRGHGAHAVAVAVVVGVGVGGAVAVALGLSSACGEGEGDAWVVVEGEGGARVRGNTGSGQASQSVLQRSASFAVAPRGKGAGLDSPAAKSISATSVVEASLVARMVL